MAKYHHTLELAPKITFIVEGDSQEEFEEDLRRVCLFGERHKFNQVAMMKNEEAYLSVCNACSEIIKGFGGFKYNILRTPDCDTFNSIYDIASHDFTEKGQSILDLKEKKKEEEEKAKPKAKSSKSEEGTVRLDPKMTLDDLAAAIKKGGMKTIDLDDYIKVKELVDELKKGK